MGGSPCEFLISHGILIVQVKTSLTLLGARSSAMCEYFLGLVHVLHLTSERWSHSRYRLSHRPVTRPVHARHSPWQTKIRLHSLRLRAPAQAHRGRCLVMRRTSCSAARTLSVAVGPWATLLPCFGHALWCTMLPGACLTHPQWIQTHDAPWPIPTTPG